MKQVTMESVKQRIAVLESAGKIVGVLGLGGEFELACLRELVALTEHSERVSKSLETALGVQADQAKRTNQLLGEIKKAEAVIGSLGWMGLDTAISLELTKLNKQISDLQGQVSLLTEQRDALVAKEQKPVAYIIQDAEMRSNGNPGFLSYDGSISDEDKNEYEISVTPLYTHPVTDSAIAALRAEGVEMFAEHLSGMWIMASETSVKEFARQLRESKGEVKS